MTSLTFASIIIEERNNQFFVNDFLRFLIKFLPFIFGLKIKHHRCYVTSLISHRKKKMNCFFFFSFARKTSRISQQWSWKAKKLFCGTNMSNGVHLTAYFYMSKFNWLTTVKCGAIWMKDWFQHVAEKKHSVDREIAKTQSHHSSPIKTSWSEMSSAIKTSFFSLFVMLFWRKKLFLWLWNFIS